MIIKNISISDAIGRHLKIVLQQDKTVRNLLDVSKDIKYTGKVMIGGKS